jgi:hypothetical protein
VEVYGMDNETSGFYDYVETYQHHGDFFTVIEVPQPGTYECRVWRKDPQEYTYSVGNTTCVLTWLYPLALEKFVDA